MIGTPPPNRDRFLLSKGHAGAAIYAALAERGFFPAERLLDHCQDGADFSGHISHKGIPGVEFSTGSLGHALPVSCGETWRLGTYRGHDDFDIDMFPTVGSPWERPLSD